MNRNEIRRALVQRRRMTFARRSQLGMTQVRRSPEGCRRFDMTAVGAAERAARATRRSQLGMTLIEIMVVVAIISLILGGVGVMAFNRFKDAQVDTARNQCVTLAGAVLQYKVQKRGRCPKSLQDLKAAGFTNQVGKDPWGNEYEFKCPGENQEVDVISGGPDNEIGTEDDISNAPDDTPAE